MNKQLQKYILSFCVSAFLIGVFTIEASAQNLTKDWGKFDSTGVNDKPAWFNSGFARGAAYGEHGGNGYFYVADRNSATIRMVNASTGTDYSPGTAFDNTGISGGTFSMNDVETSADDVIFLGNLTTDASASSFKLYWWNEPGGTFDGSTTLSTVETERIGDKFTIIGSLIDNTIEVWLPVASSNPGKVYVLSTDDNGVSWSTETITLSGASVAIGPNAGVAPLGLGRSSDFFVAGNGYHARRYSSSGAYLGYSNILKETPARSGMRAFEYNGKDFLSVYTYKSSSNTGNSIGRAFIYDVSSPASPALVMESTPIGSANSGYSGTGETYPVINSDGTYSVFVLDGNNGLAKFSGEIPELSSFGLSLTGSEGYRLLSAPTDVSYSTFLSPIWTQGITGSDLPGEGTANVMTWDNASTNGDPTNWSALGNMSTTITAGSGVLAYVFTNDTYGTPGSFPKSLTVSGQEFAGDISPTVNSNVNGFTLVGNPYASTIRFGSVSITDLTGVAYAYDPNEGASGGWKTYTLSTKAGDLTDGLIKPFQGFFVQNAASVTSPSLTFRESSKLEGGTFYGKEVVADNYNIRLQVDGAENTNSAWLSLNGNGSNTEVVYGDALELSTEMFNSQNFLEFATIKNSKLLDINQLPLSKESYFVPISFNTSTTAEYTLTATDLDLPKGYSLKFHDSNNGEILNVDENFSYTFNLYGSSKNKPATILHSLTTSTLHAKAQNSGRFKLEVIPTTPVSNEDELDTIKEFALQQNYPNPFNPTTTINYTIDKSGLVSLKVYNTMGQEVANLVQETKNAGTHSVTWDAGNVSSGIYFYRLNIAGQSSTRQMTLIK